MAKLIPHQVNSKNLPFNAKIFSWILGLFLAASLLAGDGIGDINLGEEYGPQWTKSVPLGDDFNITDVVSENCLISFKFFTGVAELDCKNLPDLHSTKCGYFNGNFHPNPCYGLKFSEGMIWKQDVGASFAFCAEKECLPFPVVIESGVIYLSLSTPSVSPTISPIASSTVRQAEQQSIVGETTTIIGTTTTIRIIGESSAWKYWFIVLSILLVVILVILIYYRRKMKKFCGRDNRAGRSVEVPVNDHPDERLPMMEIDNHKEELDSTRGKVTTLNTYTTEPYEETYSQD